MEKELEHDPILVDLLLNHCLELGKRELKNRVVSARNADLTNWRPEVEHLRFDPESKFKYRFRVRLHHPTDSQRRSWFFVAYIRHDGTIERIQV